MTCNLIIKESLTQVFSCEFCRILRTPIFTEHLCWLLLFFSIYLLFLLPAWLFHCLFFIILSFLLFSVSASLPVYYLDFSSLILYICLFLCWSFCLFLSLCKVFFSFTYQKVKINTLKMKRLTTPFCYSIAWT